MKPGKSIYFLSSKIVLLTTAVISMLLTSCAGLEQAACASIDINKQKQKGDSKDDPIASDPFINVIILTGIVLARNRVKNSSEHEASIEINDGAEKGKPKDNTLKIMPGLEFIGKGYKTKLETFSTHIHLNYLEVPVYIAYEHPLSAGSLYAGAGPYFAYGIGGKIKGDFGSVKSFGENNGGYKRFDVGLGFIAGYEMDNGLRFHIGYDLGLANIVYPGQDYSAKNRTISLNVGYDISGLFSKNKK